MGITIDALDGMAFLLMVIGLSKGVKVQKIQNELISEKYPNITKEELKERSRKIDKYIRYNMRSKKNSTKNQTIFGWVIILGLILFGILLGESIIF